MFFRRCCVAGMLVSVVCTGCEDDSQPPLPPAREIEWTPCDEFECGTLEVPRSYDDPLGPTIELALVRAPAHDQAARRGVLLFNPGGPGIPVVAGAADRYERLYADFAPQYDMVLVDNRGTGQSTPADCVTTADVSGLHLSTGELQTLADTERDAAILSDLVEACRESLGDEVLRNFDSLSVARDMEQVRIALGEEKISLLSASYGTVQAALYARLFPERVDAFVLDSPGVPELIADDRIDRGARLEAALQEFFASCGADPNCSFHGGEGEASVAAAYDSLIDALAAGTVEVDGVTQTPGLLLTGTSALLMQGNHDLLEASLVLAEAGAWDGLVQQLAPMNPLVDDEALATATASVLIGNLDMPCPADLTPQGVLDVLESAREVAPRLGAHEVTHRFVACVDWPPELVREPIASFYGPVQAPPMLVLVGAGDPAVPQQWAQSLLETLDNGSHLVVYEGDGHSVGPRSECTRTVLREFFADPSAAPGVATCPP